MIKKIPQWQSLGHLLREQAEKIGARTLLRFEGESMGFAQVEKGTNRLANVLRQHHYKNSYGTIQVKAVLLGQRFFFKPHWSQYL